MYDYHTTRVHKLSGGDQGSVGRDESPWDGHRPSSFSGRDEIKFKLLGRGPSIMEINRYDSAPKVPLIKTRTEGEKMSRPRKFWDQSRARTSCFRSSYGALVTIPDWGIALISKSVQSMYTVCLLQYECDSAYWRSFISRHLSVHFTYSMPGPDSPGPFSERSWSMDMLDVKDKDWFFMMSDLRLFSYDSD